MVGDTYTQVDSGHSPGQSVVLVDYAEAVPSSNNNVNLGSNLGGGGGAVGFFGGTGGFPGFGGAFRIQNIGGGGGGRSRPAERLRRTTPLPESTRQSGDGSCHR